MSPRPRKVSDDEIFAAAYRAMQHLGPSELTLAAIAEEAGVTAGALAQRFGSKRALLLALAKGAAGSAGAMVTGLRARHRSPLATLRAYAECLAGLASSPAAFARNLAHLQVDLADEEFREQLAVQGLATRAAIAELLGEAVDARELRRTTNVPALARNIELVLNGALLTWAFYRQGTPANFLRAAVDVALAPYVRKPASR